jgi:hypothetical protein
MKSKPSSEQIKQTTEILAKFKQFMKDGKHKAAQEYLLKMKYELCNSNK